MSWPWDRSVPGSLADNGQEIQPAAGTGVNLGPTERLLEVLAEPFIERPGLDRYAEPAPVDFGL